jgi:hypothetical protein
MIAYENNLIESQRQAIQTEIDTRKSAAERNRLGQFATPNALAVDIARYVQSVLGQNKKSIRFADPSIGSGSFFQRLSLFSAPGESAAPSESNSILYLSMRLAICGPMPVLRL